jgi:hypothetical protein
MRTEKAAFIDETCSVACSMSIRELHESVYAPFAHVMQADPGQPGGPGVLLEPVGDVLRVQRATVGPGEHIAVVAVAATDRLAVLSMLGATRTEAQRQQVVDRERAFNQILAEVCTSYSRCRWDNKAVYSYSFSASQVSSLDFFHPSLSGQAALARVTWAASWWSSS